MSAQQLGSWAIVIAVIGMFVWFEVAPHSVSGSAPHNSSNVVLDQKGIDHILYGDGRGGGHMFGADIPCKSEFPQAWDKEKILKTTTRIAANDNLDWERQNNGYRVTEEMVEGVRVRVVVDGQRGRVVTSYPTNMKRNPCPSRNPANDNRR